MLKDKQNRKSKVVMDRQLGMQLEFSGSAKEYFRIWIVNLSLTLLTFGFFSAWAKVRKKRYFYSNLTLDGTPFQYLAKPTTILKGRIIAAVLFLMYYSSTHFFTTMLPYVLVAGLAIAPWVIVRSVAFNARYSAYRNMTFRFDGTYKEAFNVIYAWGIIPVIAVGTIFNWWGIYWAPSIAYGVFTILFPWWRRNLKNFIVTRSSYGGHFGQFGVTGGRFFLIYFESVLILIGFGAIAVLHGITNTKFSPIDFIVPLYIGYIFAYAYVQAKITNIVWNRMRLGPLRFHSTMNCFGMTILYITNAIGILFSVCMLIPWAMIRTFRYRTDRTHVINMAELKEFRASEDLKVQAAGAELTEFFDMDLSI
ncbi:MAG: DUF898 domain-containing protein [Candidatus Brocadiaceae bacterium]|nr:DUF898 domain-containing protein [Candidatus Brocadiaceae bacterium]